MSSGDMTDTQCARLRPLLQPDKGKTGQPNHDHRTVINRILWIDRTGAPWRDLPERYVSWNTVYSRFYHLAIAGVWQKIVDATVVRAHQHTARTKGGKRIRRRGATRYEKTAASYAAMVTVATIMLWL